MNSCPQCECHTNKIDLAKMSEQILTGGKMLSKKERSLAEAFTRDGEALAKKQIIIDELLEALKAVEAEDWVSDKVMGIVQQAIKKAEE